MVSMAGVGILCVLRRPCAEPRIESSAVGVYARATKGDSLHCVAVTAVARLPFTPSVSFSTFVRFWPILELHTPPSTTSWVHFSQTFTATNTTHVIGFAGERNGNGLRPAHRQHQPRRSRRARADHIAIARRGSRRAGADPTQVPRVASGPDQFPGRRATRRPAIFHEPRLTRAATYRRSVACSNA